MGFCCALASDAKSTADNSQAERFIVASCLIRGQIGASSCVKAQRCLLLCSKSGQAIN